MARSGLKIAGKGQHVDSSSGLLLDSERKQFKFRDTVVVERTMVIDASNNSGRVVIRYLHGLPYHPTFISYVKGWGDKWGVLTPLRGQSAPPPPQEGEYPYWGIQEMMTIPKGQTWTDEDGDTITATDEDLYLYRAKLDLLGENSPVTFTSHTVHIHLTILYDEVPTQFISYDANGDIEDGDGGVIVP